MIATTPQLNQAQEIFGQRTHVVPMIDYADVLQNNQGLGSRFFASHIEQFMASLSEAWYGVIAFTYTNDPDLDNLTGRSYLDVYSEVEAVVTGEQRHLRKLYRFTLETKWAREKIPNHKLASLHYSGSFKTFCQRHKLRHMKLAVLACAILEHLTSRGDFLITRFDNRGDVFTLVCEDEKTICTFEMFAESFKVDDTILETARYRGNSLS